MNPLRTSNDFSLASGKYQKKQRASLKELLANEKQKTRG